MTGILHDLAFDYTLRTVALGSATLGIVSGALGAYAMLRRQSLLGDAISHTALPGIALAFMLTGSKEPIVLIVGAAMAGWLATYLVTTVTGSTRIKYDSALGIALSVFFGFGLVLLTFIQKLPEARQAGLDTFLFGQASALLERDVATMAILAVIVLACVAIFWKEFQLLSFDPGFGGSMGFSMRAVNTLLTTLLVLAIVLGLQTVGVVLMSAMVVAPAAAARQWTTRLSRMVILSAVFGACAGVCGAVLSSTTAKLPTGPTIVLCISAIVMLSLLLAPNRGLLSTWITGRRRRRQMRIQAVLLDLYELFLQHDAPGHPHAIGVMKAMSDAPQTVRSSLAELRRRGLVVSTGRDQWALTPSGVDAARDAERGLKGEM